MNFLQAPDGVTTDVRVESQNLETPNRSNQHPTTSASKDQLGALKEEIEVLKEGIKQREMMQQQVARMRNTCYVPSKMETRNCMHTGLPGFEDVY